MVFRTIQPLKWQVNNHFLGLWREAKSERRSMRQQHHILFTQTQFVHLHYSDEALPTVVRCIRVDCDPRWQLAACQDAQTVHDARTRNNFELVHHSEKPSKNMDCVTISDTLEPWIHSPRLGKWWNQLKDSCISHELPQKYRNSERYQTLQWWDTSPS